MINGQKLRTFKFVGGYFLIGRFELIFDLCEFLLADVDTKFVKVRFKLTAYFELIFGFYLLFSRTSNAKDNSPRSHCA